MEALPEIIDNIHATYDRDSFEIKLNPTISYKDVIYIHNGHKICYFDSYKKHSISYIPVPILLSFKNIKNSFFIENPRDVRYPDDDPEYMLDPDIYPNLFFDYTKPNPNNAFLEHVLKKSVNIESKKCVINTQEDQYFFHEKCIYSNGIGEMAQSLFYLNGDHFEVSYDKVKIMSTITNDITAIMYNFKKIYFGNVYMVYDLNDILKNGEYTNELTISFKRFDVILNELKTII